MQLCPVAYRRYRLSRRSEGFYDRVAQQEAAHAQWTADLFASEHRRDLHLQKLRDEHEAEHLLQALSENCKDHVWTDLYPYEKYGPLSDTTRSQRGIFTSAVGW